MSSEPTPLDLSWRMFGFPIRVSPWFWLTTAFLGWGYQAAGFQYLLTWIVCVFVSILIHELGHAFAFRTFGLDAHILLTSFCGLTFGSSDPSRRWQRIVVSLAGPAADFVLGGIFSFPEWNYGPDLARGRHELLLEALNIMFFVNIVWGVLNLLPIWPLDGGQVCREVCQHFSRRNGVRISLGISLVVAGALAVNALASMLLKRPILPFLGVGGLFMVFFFGLFAFQSWAELQQLQARDRQWNYPEEERAPWEQDPDAWKRGG